MKRLIILYTVILSFPGWTGWAQTPLTLDYCLDKAANNSSLSDQEAYYLMLHDLNQDNNSSFNYPTLDLNGTASYQSDVFSLPFQVPGADVPVIPKEQFKLTLDLFQPIYQGGKVNRNREKDLAQLELNNARLESELYQIKIQVQQIYYSALIFQEREKLLEALIDDLLKQYSTIESRIENGVLLPSAGKKFYQQILTYEQDLEEVRLNRKTYRALLELWIEEEIQADRTLVIPVATSIAESNAIDRPELRTLEYESQLLEASKGLTGISRKPVLGVFASAGFGYPNALNPFEVQVSPWAIAGLKLYWNIWDWKRVNRNTQELSVRQQIITSRKEHLNKQFKATTIQKSNEILQYEAILARDSEIVSLQEEVTQESYTQLNNGVISSTDYLSEQNKLLQAKLKQQLHLIMLSKAKSDYIIQKGEI